MCGVYDGDSFLGLRWSAEISGLSWLSRIGSELEISTLRLVDSELWGLWLLDAMGDISLTTCDISCPGACSSLHKMTR
jgi:hypothetical protein